MKVKDAIAMLSQADPEEHVIIGWWSRDLFSSDYEIDDNTWASICQDLIDLTDRANEDVYNEVIYQLNKSGIQLREDF